MKFMLNLIKDIFKIQAEWDSINVSEDDIPSVFSHQLIKLRGKDIGRIILQHQEYLKIFWDEEDIKCIQEKHYQLLFVYKYESILDLELNMYDDSTEFEVGWLMIDNMTWDFLNFCGDIATVFANTASIESDFSILGWEKDDIGWK